MALAQMTPVNLVGISHFPKKNVLMTEASLLGLPVGHRWEQVPDDACDVGIATRSPKTGKVVSWVLVDTVYDNDGDVLHWVFIIATPEVRKHPQLAGYRLEVLND